MTLPTESLHQGFVEPLLNGATFKIEMLRQAYHAIASRSFHLRNGQLRHLFDAKAQQVGGDMEIGADMEAHRESWVGEREITFFLSISEKKRVYSPSLPTYPSNMATIRITTSLGTITVRLYDETPRHRDNFLKLAKEGFYDGTLFHRVIRDFMIQAGDPDSKGAEAGKMLGMGDPGYTLEAEILPELFHKRGALAAARQGDEVNPERRSSGSQFYIVWGKTYNEGQLKQLEKQLQMQAEQQIFQTLANERREQIMEMRRNRDREALALLQDELATMAKTQAKASAAVGFSPAAREAYTTLGGTPFLDGQYTVFGEVTEGLDVVEQIQNVETGQADRPLQDLDIRVTIIEE